MAVPVQSFLKRRRDRALGSLMGYIEREVYPQLKPSEQVALRRVVLASLDGYHDSVLDLVKAEDGIRNEEVVALLERLDRRIRTGVPSRVDPHPGSADESGMGRARAEV